MNNGKILVADYQRMAMMKLVGDVRVVLSSTLDGYCKELYGRGILDGMLIDLSDTASIDSTALGLLAKLSIQLRNRFNVIPRIICPNPDIHRVLSSMSFDTICEIMTCGEVQAAKFDELNIKTESEATVRDKVIDAHLTLMTMSEENRLEFQELVSALKHQN
jgi:anti-anti-sigma regulatory factor